MARMTGLVWVRSIPRQISAAMSSRKPTAAPAGFPHGPWPQLPTRIRRHSKCPLYLLSSQEPAFPFRSRRIESIFT